MGKGALRNAVELGDVENGSLMAGQISGMISKVQSAREIIEEMFEEYEELKRAF